MSEHSARPGAGNTGTTGYIDLIRTNPNFRSLWLGQVVSLFGDWFNLIASAALISKLTQSNLAVGGLFVVRMLAPFLISPIAGVAADRYNRKLLLILTDLLRAVIVLGFLFIDSPRQVWLLYTLTALQLGLSGFFFPTRNAILPDIVSRRELGTANALSASTWSVMLAVGAALGGLVTGSWGIQPSFAIDAVTFLLSAFFIARIGYQHIPNEKTITVPAVFQEYLEGLSYLNQHRDILATAMLKGSIALVTGGVFQVVEVAIAKDIYPLGEGGGISLGLIYMSAGIGTGIGPILARRLTGDNARRLRLAIILAYGLSALGMTVIAAQLGWGGSRLAVATGFAVVLVGAFTQAVGGGINWVFSTQLLLQALPDRVRGRVFSTEFAMFTLANAISAAVGGWALDTAGLSLSETLWAVAALVLVPGTLWTLWTLRLHRRPEELPLPKTPPL